MILVPKVSNCTPIIVDMAPWHRSNLLIKYHRDLKHFPWAPQMVVVKSKGKMGPLLSGKNPRLVKYDSIWLITSGVDISSN